MGENSNENSIKSLVEQSIIVLYYGEFEVTDEMFTFNELNLQGKPDLERTLRKLYKIDSLPCILAYGSVFSMEEIAAVQEIEREFNKKQLDAAIDLIKTQKRVIFIKGTPTRPQCRFTKELLGIFQEEGLSPERDYKSVNVLETDAVREGIKEYGDWPTYPQVYINHELAGGLDVIKAERAQGRIRAVLGLQ
ncbi:uncharacterized protein NESG_01405 [Nematocida ausubeli]|uniref:Glutaredoxin domain-containing protein n=1 Tax=Nematocida ausubeli (strain ATCC PRA-371 / ERTm2) TaxID=1913371 RepID=A0A086J2B7_NEMA1|nr:uncharacterized protein NESG_01405 [Nematocida ausubeli]KFG26285.1 hypothetical protein NESG_01405 [Nematocida ausubeli]